MPIGLGELLKIDGCLDCYIQSYFLDMSYTFEYRIFGVMLFIVWVFSLIKITVNEKFYNKPHSYKEFLRNIVYEKK